jgi:YjbE family integral membrane protein
MIVDATAPTFDASIGQAAFWIAALRIVAINMLLSGDNVVVIALACRGLRRRQRLWGVTIGAGLAIILRIVFAGAVAEFMAQPYLKIGGGLGLFYIALKLLLPEEPDETEVQAAAHLWRAVRIVVVADVIMSFDNALGIAMAAQGNLALIVFGLAISVPIIIAGAALITALLDRFPVLIWLGSALLGWVAGEAIVTDTAVATALSHAFPAEVVRDLQWAAAGVGAVLVLVIGALWRRYLAKARP